jgi:hypothetical protein
MVRFDFESAVTRRYDLREIAAAIAAFPYTTACSPNTITFPGAETMNGGIMGIEFLLGERGGLDVPEPLLSVSVICSLGLFND